MYIIWKLSYFSQIWYLVWNYVTFCNEKLIKFCVDIIFLEEKCQGMTTLLFCFKISTYLVEGGKVGPWTACLFLERVYPMHSIAIILYFKVYKNDDNN